MGKIIPLIIGIGVLAATIFLSAPGEVIRAISGFDRSMIIPVLLLSFANYFVRFIRWEILLRCTPTRLKLKDSLAVFFSAFLFSIAPAKSGDLVKAYYLEKKYNAKYAIGIPVVVLERAYDVFGIVFLIALSSIAYFGRAYFLASAAIIFSVFFATIFIKDLSRFFFEHFKAPVFKTQFVFLRKALFSAGALFSRRVSLASLFLGTVAWFFECLGLYLVVTGFGLSHDVARETFVYSASTLGGAASMLPGGLGVTEGGMAVLLSRLGQISFSSAFSITLVIRAFTLWFAVLLGFFAMIFMARANGRHHRNRR